MEQYYFIKMCAYLPSEACPEYREKYIFPSLVMKADQSSERSSEQWLFFTLRAGLILINDPFVEKLKLDPITESS
jgi:hypothetical protein